MCIENVVLLKDILVVTEGVREGCHGDARDVLEEICMKLPEERCISSPYYDTSMCEEEEFDCGYGNCIHGLGLCDNKYQCLNGADELMW